MCSAVNDGVLLRFASDMKKCSNNIMPVFGLYIKRRQCIHNMQEFSSTHARNLAPQHLEVHFEDIV